MRTGDEVKVKLLHEIGENSARVEILQSGDVALLKIKGRLRIRPDGTITAWVIQNNAKKGDIVLGNAYFGKYSISSNISDRYLRIINAIYATPSLVTDEDISVMKGMVNRCIKHDQWDWYTTYKYLGYPSYHIMNTFAKESIIVRDSLRRKSFDELRSFREKYSFLLKSIEHHLQQNHSLSDLQDDDPILSLEQELWDRMSSDSKNNLKIAEHVSNTASKYVLMHYLVTIEQEFFSHYIQPFIENVGKDIQSTCENKYLTTTHQILIGETHFSLGAIYHIGRALKKRASADECESIKEFRKYLGNRSSVFIDICNLISSKTICGLRITELRNGLAHGIPEIVSQIDSSAFLKLQDILFSDPDFLMRKMLKNSLRY